MHLHAKRYSAIYPKTLGVRPGYGERRVRREVARAPLFAGLPDWVESAESYERGMAERNTRWVQEARRHIAEGWCRVRRWLDQASAADTEEFARHWRYLPHAPEYALDIITQIERQRSAEVPFPDWRIP